MTPFHSHKGIMAALDIDNVDTDQIIPSREMRQVSRSGLSDGLFAGWRYTDPETRTLNPDFVLNRPGQAATSVLVSGWNFGCGSSREHAVWALAEFGIRCIIAKSFGEIFQGNCIRNGVLPVVLEADDVDYLIRHASGRRVEVDLPAQTVSLPSDGAWVRSFEVDSAGKRMLVDGLDPIGLTLTHEADIKAFIAADALERPWLYA